MENVLITGGSGLIGNRLTRLLQEERFNVAWFSRREETFPGVKIFPWDPEKKFIEEEALKNADHIIHLAGANVGKYWTSRYKKKILTSRVDSAQLLFEKLSFLPNKVKTFISASGVGYYGDGGVLWLTEDSLAGHDFLAHVCIKWEEVAKQFERLDKRVVMLRTGITLSKEGGSLPALIFPMKFVVAPIFGNGNQFYSWIHINDLCRIYLHAIKNGMMSGVYNACAPEPVRFKELIHEIAVARHKPKINFPIPKFLIQLMLDGFGGTLFSSLRCSSKKIEEAGFHFQHADLKTALDNLMRN